jgi:hypothetical protein
VVVEETEMVEEMVAEAVKEVMFKVMVELSVLYYVQIINIKTKTFKTTRNNKAKKHI